MAIQVGKVRSHWNYFLAIERDLEVLSRYVEFDESNSPTPAPPSPAARVRSVRTRTYGSWAHDASNPAVPTK